MWYRYNQVTGVRMYKSHPQCLTAVLSQYWTGTEACDECISWRKGILRVTCFYEQCALLERGIPTASGKDDTGGENSLSWVGSSLKHYFLIFYHSVCHDNTSVRKRESSDSQRY